MERLDHLDKGLRNRGGGRIIYEVLLSKSLCLPPSLPWVRFAIRKAILMSSKLLEKLFLVIEPILGRIRCFRILYRRKGGDLLAGWFGGFLFVAFAGVNR